MSALGERQDGSRAVWISGAARCSYLVVWLVVFAFAALGAWRYAAHLRVEIGPAQRYGVQLRDPSVTAGDEDRIVQFPLGRYAETVLRSGDRIVAVDGRLVPRGSGALRTQLEAAAGKPVTVTVERAGQRRAVRLTADPRHAADGFGESGIGLSARVIARAAIFLLTFFAGPTALAMLLLARRRRDPLTPLASLAMILNALGSGPALYALSGTNDGALGTATAIACPLAGWAQIAVLALFPDRNLTDRWTRVVVLGSLPLMYWMRVESSVFETNLALLAGQLAAVAVVWRRYLVLPQGTGRQQIRWALFGFGASLAMQALTIVAQNLFFNTADPAAYVWLNLLADLLAGAGVTLLFGSLTLGLMRYRLYDADATISLSIAYGALTLALVAVFAGSEKVIEVLGEEYFGGSLGAFASGLGAAIAAAMIGPLHHRVTRWAEKRFRTGLVQLRHGLPEIVGDMRETATPQHLTHTMLARVERGVRARHGAVVVGDTVLDTRDIDSASAEAWLAKGVLDTAAGHKLHCDRSDPLFPLRVPLRADAVGLVGWLLLGPRPDGSFYGREEREALAEIADPVARALAIASERQAREIAHRREIESLGVRIEELGRFVHDHLRFDGGAPRREATA